MKGSQHPWLKRCTLPRLAGMLPPGWGRHHIPLHLIPCCVPTSLFEQLAVAVPKEGYPQKKRGGRLNSGPRDGDG